MSSCTVYWAQDRIAEILTQDLVPLVFLIPLALGRFAIRWQTYGRLFHDDFAYSAALVFTIAYVIIDATSWSCQTDYYVHHISLSRDVASDCVFYIAVWALDLCLAFHYRAVFWVSTTFRKFWYAVMGYLALSVVTSMGTFSMCRRDVFFAR